jgi:hypothetical protein
LNYPLETYDRGQELIFSVFLGFAIDRKKKNPFAQSNIKLRFAISSSHKYIVMPSSYTKDITAIKGASVSVHEYRGEALLEHWEGAIKASITDRQIRYIITGNLLQAFSSFKGKLVSYTTIDKGIKKGILMPEYWSPEEGKADKIVVPIERAMKVIVSLGNGSQISTNNGISFFKRFDDYKMLVPASKQKGGQYYLNPQILELVNNYRFEKVADRMVATVEGSVMKTLIGILQEKFNTSVTLTPYQFEIIKNDLPAKEEYKSKVLTLNNTIKKIRQGSNIFELEALALNIKLKLLKFAA